VDDLQILPPGVHQFEDRCVEEQVVERRQIPHGERVHGDGHRFRTELDQAEPGK